MAITRQSENIVEQRPGGPAFFVPTPKSRIEAFASGGITPEQAAMCVAVAEATHEQLAKQNPLLSALMENYYRAASKTRSDIAGSSFAAELKSAVLDYVDRYVRTLDSGASDTVQSRMVAELSRQIAGPLYDEMGMLANADGADSPQHFMMEVCRFVNVLPLKVAAIIEQLKSSLEQNQGLQKDMTP